MTRHRQFCLLPRTSTTTSASASYVGDVLAGKLKERIEAKEAEGGEPAGRKPPRWLAELPDMVDLSNA